MNIKLIKVANETVKISKEKEYILNNKKIIIKTNTNHSIFQQYKRSSITLTDPGELKKIHLNTYDKKIEVTEQSTVDTIYNFSKLYQDETIGVLNFASAKHPGGGFLNGAVAQEECLAYCSDLYLKQKDQEYYEINKKYNQFYTDTMIISQVNFFRDTKYNFVDTPVECCVITCPAVNRKIAGYTRQADNKMKNRMRKILIEFINHKQTNIILGAYGCGVFGNKPEQIATFWKELLFEENLIIHFNHISFSVIGKHNYEIFNRILGD